MGPRGTASLVTWAKCSIGVPLCELCMSSCYSRVLIAAGISVGGIGPQGNWLWGPAATTVNELLWRGSPDEVGFALVGLQCQHMPPFMYTCCGAGWVGLCWGLKPATGDHLVGATKWFVVIFSSCWYLRHLGWAKLQVKPGCYLRWALDPLVGTTVWAEANHCLCDRVLLW